MMRVLRGRSARRLLAAAVAGLAVSAAIPASAAAIEFTRLGAELIDRDGQPTRQAGSHPDVRFVFVTPDDGRTDGVGPRAIIAPKRMRIDLPPGLLGDPTAFPTCTMQELTARGNGGIDWCPPESQVGTADVPGVGPYYGVFNMETLPGHPAVFAFNAFGVIVMMKATVRPDDYGITIDTGYMSQGTGGFHGADVTLWGIPADPQHDPLRVTGDGWGSVGASTTARRVPFLTTPTSCSGRPDVTRVWLEGWDDAGNEAIRTFDADFDGRPFTATGCEKLPFDPTIAAIPTTSVADAPTGLQVDLTVPQNGTPHGFATAHVRDVTVQLPLGMSISPASAAGLVGCSDAEIGLGSAAAARCPDASKVGTVAIETPLLKEPMTGSVYVGTQQSNDPMSGKLFRLFLVAEGSDVRVKLEGGVQADPVTGQVTTTFSNNPQLPFDKLTLKLFSGPDAPLATPAACGTHTTNTTVTSWSGKSVSGSSSFNIDCRAGLGGFAPAFAAGTTQPVAGAFSPFGVGISKPDGDAPLNGLRMRLPDGLTAKLAGNEGTVIGSVQALAGPGSRPFPLPGTVRLEGAYGDAPFSLRVVVPAKAGPFDLGEVVVRQRIYVDRATARVTIVSDPIPTIVSGVPVRMQRLDVNVDKPGFMINPTSCAPKAIDATLASSSGATAQQSVRFQVGDCAALPFAPKMGFKVGARGRTGKDKRTPLVVSLAMSGGQANNRSVEVTLPKALNARLDVIQRDTACTIQQYNADACPNPVGTASAVTPLLRDPLRGSVYFVYNPERRLPDLVARLKGQVPIDLVGKVTITRDFRLQTTFDTIPDVPIKTFRMALESGERTGPIGITRNLCQSATRRDLRAEIAYKAQSNRTVTRSQQIKVAGCGKAKARGKAKSRAQRRASKRAAARATTAAVLAAANAVAASRTALGR